MTSSSTKNQDVANGSNRRFEHAETTEGSRSAIWNLWTDVESWEQWDDGLKEARLDGPFGVGATGTIVPNSGPAATFEITEYEDTSSYTFRTKMPGAKLNVRREFIEGASTTFRHTVWFEGPLTPIWAVLAGRQFRRQLPPTMRKLAELAAGAR